MLPILKPTHTFRENQVLTPEEQQQIANGDGIKIKTYDIITTIIINFSAMSIRIPSLN